MDCVGEAPDPPIVGKVSHTSVELIWDHSLLEENKSFKKATKKPTTKYVIQEEELGGLVTKGYGTVYSGFAIANTFNGLEPRTTYRYRIKYKYGSTETPWSRVVEVSTTKRPSTADDLHRAVLKNDLKAVKRLLQELNKDLIDAVDKFGYTPLMNAGFKGYKHVVEVLIENNADVSFQNNSGKNALMVASYAGQLEVVKVLRRNGASWLSHDKTGSSPLHWAIDGGNVELIRWMLTDGCKVDEKDTTSGWTPLMRLCSMSGDVQTARMLINNGADVDVLDNSRKSILMIAALNGHTSLVKLLLTNGAKVDVKSLHGKTALDFARSFDHRQIIQMLDEKYKEMRKKQKLLETRDQYNVLRPIVAV